MRSWSGCLPDGFLCTRSCVWHGVSCIFLPSLQLHIGSFSFPLQQGAPCGNVALLSPSVYRSMFPSLKCCPVNEFTGRAYFGELLAALTVLLVR